MHLPDCRYVTTCTGQSSFVRNEHLHTGTGAYIFKFISALGQKRIEVVVFPELAPNQIDESVHK